MPSTIHLRRKIRSITNTKQITRAMQMVAASKMRRAQEAVLGTRAYAQVGYEVIARLRLALAQSDNITHPFFQARVISTITLVVISSDKGLAGGYNANVLRKTLQLLEEYKDKNVRIVTVGRKIQEALKRLNIELQASFSELPTHPTSLDIMPIARLTIDAFLGGETDQVSVIFTNFYSTLRQLAEERQVLPIAWPTGNNEEQKNREDEEKATGYVFEPDPQLVLDSIVPRMVEMQLYESLLESIASEHSARMIAMKNATDNASDLIEDLQLTYNSVRQANITREIAEISAGANV